VLRCADCSLVFLGNPPDETGLYDEYHGGPGPDPTAYTADSHVPELRELHAINLQRCAWIRSTSEGKSLLDIGCGRGFFVKSAQREGFLAQGIDVAGAAIRYANERLNAPAGQETIDAVAAQGRTYDIITMWHVLEHLARPRDALQTARSLLAPGGMLYLEVPNWNSLKFVLTGRRWEGGNHPRFHRTFFTPATLSRCLTSAGYAYVTRARISYAVPGRGDAYRLIKRALNEIGRDAFLDFSARA
jgi:SAM-dependent methyltransferase